MKFLEATEHGLDLVLLRQYCRSEVIGAGPLAETRTRDHADTGRLEELERVEDVRLLAGCLGSLYRLFRQVDPRKHVHCAHRWIRLQCYLVILCPISFQG